VCTPDAVPDQEGSARPLSAGIRDCGSDSSSSVPLRGWSQHRLGGDDLLQSQAVLFQAAPHGKFQIRCRSGRGAKAMIAVILADGSGTRIQSATQGRPKCLLNVGGRAILDYQVESLWAAGVSEIGIVTGYQGHEIIEHIDQNFGEDFDSFHFMRNPLYSATNNIYSLWMAREWAASDDFVCLNADVLCHPAILPPALKRNRPVTMIVDPEWRDETMKVVIE